MTDTFEKQAQATREETEGRENTPFQDVPEGAVEIPVEIVTDKKADEEAAAASEPAEEAATEEAAAEPEPQPTVEELLDKIADLEAAKEEQKQIFANEVKDLRMRALAEQENFKKRLTREHDEHLKYAAEKVMQDIIPSLDNLELAITYAAKDEACKNLLQGVEMTQKLLLDAVGRHGLVRVGQEGDAFDPALHEAIGTESRPDLAADTVTRVLQSGYNLQGRLLRPAKVMVNRP